MAKGGGAPALPFVAVQQTDQVGVARQQAIATSEDPWTLGTVPLEELSMNAGIVIPTSSSNDRLTYLQSSIDNLGIMGKISPTLPVDSSSVTISEVWNDGVESAFAEIRQILREKVDASSEYMVALDTEFAIPDGIGRPPNQAGGGEPRTADGHYSQLRAYANGGSLVQVGLGFADEHYNLIAGKMFQFNIRFDAAWREAGHSGVAVMRRAGVKLEGHATRGIPAERFVELLASSGLLGNDELVWITFMGYVDFGYLIALLRLKGGENKGLLPASREEFLDEFRAAFPRSYDCKVFSKYGGCAGEPAPGGLTGVAQELAVKRVGQAHQAASDALVALRCHRKLMRLRPDFGAKICNMLYGVCTFYAPSLN